MTSFLESTGLASGLLARKGAMRRCPTPARESLKSLLESLRSFLVFPKGVPETSKTSFPEFRAVGRLQQGAYMFEGSLGWGLGAFRWHIMI